MGFEMSSTLQRVAETAGHSLLYSVFGLGSLEAVIALLQLGFSRFGQNVQSTLAREVELCQ